MTKLVLHRFGAKYSFNAQRKKRIVEPDFDVEETANNGKRQYVLSIELDKNEQDDNGNEIPNSTMREKLIGKSLAQVKTQLQSKPKAQAFTKRMVKGVRNEKYSFCHHCVEQINQAVNP